MTPPPRRLLLGASLIVAGMFAFSCNVIVAKHLFERGTDPLTMLTVRSVGLWLVLAVILCLLRQPIRLPARQRWHTLALGVLMAVQTWCFYSGIARIPVSVATIVEYTYPFQVAMAAHFLGRESLTVRKVVTILFAFAGLVLVLEGPGIGVGSGIDPLGLGFIVAGSILVTVMILVSHRVLAVIDSRRFCLYTNATIGLLGVAIFVLSPLAPTWPEVAGDWGLLGLIPFLNLIGVLGMFTGLSIVGPGRAAMIANSEPVFVLVLAAVVLGDTLSPVQLPGAVVVIGAIVVFQIERAASKGVTAANTRERTDAT